MRSIVIIGIESVLGSFSRIPLTAIVFSLEAHCHSYDPARTLKELEYLVGIQDKLCSEVHGATSTTRCRNYNNKTVDKACTFG
ncbi:MAG: hypothetical protein UHG68_08050 [Clostridia bacterium]|nr:hypothetical protein [Clostridia bacterium]